MKLSELRNKIAEIPAEYDDCEVVLQKGPEGNGYSPLYYVDSNAVYILHSDLHHGYGGDVYCMDESAEDLGMGEEEWEKSKRENRCIVLAP